MPNPSAAMLVIGDEILSGRTRDANMHHLAQKLSEQGIDLKEARFIADESETIIRNIRALSAQYDHVFTSGGIGPTHDDITADCVAQAFDKSIGVRADARAILEAHYARQGSELNAARLRMARIPDTATLIENPVSSAPGFSLENVHVMAGVPSVFQAMLASILPELSGGAPLGTRSFIVSLGEGDIAEALAKLNDQYDAVGIGSYPFQRDGKYGSNVVLRSAEVEALDRAGQALLALFGSDVVEH